MVVYENWYGLAIAVPDTSLTPVDTVTMYAVLLCCPLVPNTAWLPEQDSNIQPSAFIVMFAMLTVPQFTFSFQLIVTLELSVTPVELFAGVVLITEGAAVTVKTPVPVPVPPSGFVTVTFLAPVAAPPAIVMFAVNCVELLYVVLLTVMPVPLKLAASPAPLTKPVPLIVISLFVAP